MGLWSLPLNHPAGADVPQGLPQPCLVCPDLGRGLHFGCLWHRQPAGLGGKGQSCPRCHKHKAALGTASWRGSCRAPDAASVGSCQSSNVVLYGMGNCCPWDADSLLWCIGAGWAARGHGWHRACPKTHWWLPVPMWRSLGHLPASLPKPSTELSVGVSSQPLLIPSLLFLVHQHRAVGFSIIFFIFPSKFQISSLFRLLFRDPACTVPL